MNGDAEKCDAYDKIDSASNNLNLVFILIHVKLEFIDVKIRRMAGISKSGNELHSEAEGRPKGEGGALRGNSFPRAPGGGRVAAGVKEAKPPLLNRKSQP